MSLVRKASWRRPLAMKAAAIWEEMGYFVSNSGSQTWLQDGIPCGVLKSVDSCLPFPEILIELR